MCDDDPHGEFTGKNILVPGAHAGRDGRAHFRRPPSEVRSRTRIARRQILLASALQARPAAPGRQNPHRLERPDDLGFRQGGAVLDDPAMRRRRGAPRIFFIGTMYSAGAATCCGAFARATPRSPASSTTTPCSPRRCSICTRRPSTRSSRASRRFAREAFSASKIPKTAASLALSPARQTWC